MPFRYRLDKVLKYRIQKRDEQLDVVRAAQREVMRIQAEIDKNVNTVDVLKKGIYQAHHTMMEAYDKYIKHLYEIIKKLEEDKQEAIKRLEYEKEVLAEREKEVKVLEKHKEKAREIYKEEEKKAEMKRLDEVAGQKYYAKMQEKINEELADLERLQIDES